MMILETKNLTKTFSGKWGKKLTALDDLSLSVKQGSVFGFIGPNGAGKSTTIKILMGLMSPTSGSARLCELPVREVKSRQNVGYLPENPKYHGYLTGEELLHMSAEIRGLSTTRINKEIKELLSKVHLEESGRRPIRTYSKGMVQRLGLANAMIGDPQLLVLDEPMSGLDPIGRNLVRKLMLDMKGQGKTIFFSSHILHDVETICDEIAILLLGKLKFHGRLDSVLLQTIEVYDARFVVPPDCAIEEFLVMQKIAFQKHDDGMISAMITKKKIDDVLPTLLSLHCSLVSLEPRHHSLEEYFMELLNGS